MSAVGAKERVKVYYLYSVSAVGAKERLSAMRAKERVKAYFLYIYIVCQPWELRRG